MSKIIAIDFDGTLCANAYPKIGAPNTDIINRAKAEQSNGAKLILWTCRTGEYLRDAVSWCANYGLFFDAVNDNLPETADFYGGNTRKVAATEYWDDRAIPTEAPSCERCKLRRETTKSKYRIYPWCANCCKNYTPK